MSAPREPLPVVFLGGPGLADEAAAPSQALAPWVHAVWRVRAGGGGEPRVGVPASELLDARAPVAELLGRRASLRGPRGRRGPARPAGRGRHARPPHRPDEARPQRGAGRELSRP